jgi:dipeptidase
MCDTFIALQSMSPDGSVIFGKNSDREPNEAQVLEYHPARVFSNPGKVRCTYLDIPQVKATYAVLLSRPFWMWGAEMGANENGVVIGNEAVFTRMPLNKAEGLTGMDLLRLALERSATAASALETIVQLLADFGQGGVCGYEDKRMAYHNSFIIADPNEGWVLETAGRLWAALKIKKFYAISNGLTIGEIFDEAHPELIPTARKNGWLKKGDAFDFALCYSDWFYTTFSASKNRRSRAIQLIDATAGKMDVAAAMQILRDHRDAHYRPDTHFLGNRICAHAGNKIARRATQTTGSLIAHLNADAHTFWATGTAAPCTSIFKPIRFEGEVLPDIGPNPGGKYNPASLWWYHEQLHRLMLLDYPERVNRHASERSRLEVSFMESAARTPSGAWSDFTRDAFRTSRLKTDRWLYDLQQLPGAGRSKLMYRRYWTLQNIRSQIDL